MSLVFPVMRKDKECSNNKSMGVYQNGEELSKIICNGQSGYIWTTVLHSVGLHIK